MDAIADAVEGSIDDVTLLGLFLATAMLTCWEMISKYWFYGHLKIYLTLIGFNPNPVAPIMEANLRTRIERLTISF